MTLAGRTFPDPSRFDETGGSDDGRSEGTPFNRNSKVLICCRTTLEHRCFHPGQRSLSVGKTEHASGRDADGTGFIGQILVMCLPVHSTDP